MAQQTFIDKATGDTIILDTVSKTGTYTYDTTTMTRIPYVPPVDPDPSVTVNVTRVDVTKQIGSGPEQWHDQNQISGVVSTDVYVRTTWNILESSKGNYNFTLLDGYFKNCIDTKRKLSFGIMTVYPDGPTVPGNISYNGGYSAYPLYVNQVMQAESVKSWKTAGGLWIPNWNSVGYSNALLILHKAIDNWMKTTSYKGVKYIDAMNYIDIRGYGAYGEWHSAGIVDDVKTGYPTGTGPTFDGLKRIVDAHKDGFPDTQLQFIISALDKQTLPNVWNPPTIADYVLTARNNKNVFGWRRDNWGDPYTYEDTWLSDPRAFSRYKVAPATGEPCCSDGSQFAKLKEQVVKYHATSFGNGNFDTLNSTVSANAKAAWAAIKPHLFISSGQVTKSSVVQVNLNWTSDGTIPLYEDWKLVIELRQGTNVVQTITSAWSPKYRLDSSASSDVLTKPSGSFDVWVRLTSTNREDLLNVKIASF